MKDVIQKPLKLILELAKVHEENKDCSKCNKLLIVDDNEYNLFVLQNYLKSFNMIADEVGFLITNINIGCEWKRSNNENHGKIDESVLQVISSCTHGY